MTFLEYGESWIFYIEIVREEDNKPKVLGKVFIKEKVEDIRQFELDMQNEINSKIRHKIKVQAAAKRRPTKEQADKRMNEVGEYFMFHSGNKTNKEICKKFNISAETVKNYLDKYFIINNIGVPNK